MVSNAENLYKLSKKEGHSFTGARFVPYSGMVKQFGC
jgi:hypothetical protein